MYDCDIDTTYIFEGIIILHAIFVPYFDGKDVIESFYDLPVIDDVLIWIVTYTHLYQSLQGEVDEVHSLSVDIKGEILQEIGNFCYDIHTSQVVFLFPEIVLHVSVLPVTHQSKYLQS